MTAHDTLLSVADKKQPVLFCRVFELFDEVGGRHLCTISTAAAAPHGLVYFLSSLKHRERVRRCSSLVVTAAAALGGGWEMTPDLRGIGGELVSGVVGRVVWRLTVLTFSIGYRDIVSGACVTWCRLEVNFRRHFLLRKHFNFQLFHFAPAAVQMYSSSASIICDDVVRV